MVFFGKGGGAKTVPYPEFVYPTDFERTLSCVFSSFDNPGGGGVFASQKLAPMPPPPPDYACVLSPVEYLISLS